MLSIIPAVLMLVLNGPAGVEGSVADGRIGNALRAWASRQLGQPEALATPEAPLQSRIEALRSLGQEFPELSWFLTEVFQFSADGLWAPPPEIPKISRIAEPTVRWDRALIPHPAPELRSQRSRDGPLPA